MAFDDGNVGDGPAAYWLALLLRVFGVVCLLALFPLFMPAAWIHGTHEWLGWGEFPSQPVAEYLARATSSLAAFLGGLCVMLATDVRRYAVVIRYTAVGVMGYSACGLGLGTAAGLPLWFTLGDFVGCAIFCIPFWVLAGKVKQTRTD